MRRSFEKHRSTLHTATNDSLNRKPLNKKCVLFGRGRYKKALGFTLVELLVVITIIGMLMALAFPAIGAVLEQAKRARCANNLKGQGTALATYEATNGCLPPGQPSCMAPEEQWRTGGSDFGADCQGPNWAVALLSYLDEKPMAANVKKCLRSKNTGSFCANTCEDIAREEFGSIGTTALKIHICPSAEQAIEGLAGGDATWGLEGLVKGNYAANFGAGTFDDAITQADDTVADRHAKLKLRGSFWVTTIPRPRGTGKKSLLGSWKTGEKTGMKKTMIRGSSSRTILLSEVKGYESSIDGRGVWTNTSMGASIFTAKTPPNAAGSPDNEEWYDHIQICDTNIPEEDPSDMHCVLVRNKNNQVWAAARSEHTGLVNVLYCDLHVEAVIDTINPAVWQGQATLTGGDKDQE